MTADDEIAAAANGALTALATIVVAIFTVVLALVTRRQARLTKTLAASTEVAAKAAEDSASALPRLERAYLFVQTDPDSLGNLRHAIQQAKVHTFETIRVNVSYELVNHGKTPALLKAQRFTMQYRADTDSPALVPPEPISAGAIRAVGFHRIGRAPRHRVARKKAWTVVLRRFRSADHCDAARGMRDRRGRVARTMLDCCRQARARHLFGLDLAG